MEKLFEEAYQKTVKSSVKLPPDVMLRLYALYKQATRDITVNLKGSSELVHAFKMNARMQVKHLSKKEAQKKYINLVNEHLK